VSCRNQSDKNHGKEDISNKRKQSVSYTRAASKKKHHPSHRDVGPHAPPPAAQRLQRLAQHQVGQEEGLLRHRQHQRAQRGDVGLQGLARDRHELFAQAHAPVPLPVLLLVHALEGGVGRGQVGADDVLEAVLGAPAEQDRGGFKVVCAGVCFVACVVFFWFFLVKERRKAKK